MKKSSIRELESVLRIALTKLDERGTNDSVSKAMSIVSVTLNEMSNGRLLTPENAYKIGIKNAACE